MWLRGNDKSAVDRELSRLQAFVSDKSDPTKCGNIKDLFTDRGNLKALIIAVMLGVGQQTCGINVLVSTMIML